MKIINPKPLSEVRKEKEMAQSSIGEIHQLARQISASFVGFLEFCFYKFPPKA